MTAGSLELTLGFGSSGMLDIPLHDPIPHNRAPLDSLCLRASYSIRGGSLFNICVLTDFNFDKLL